jgi:threonine/homoserine/homoserine lactone efflux protein
MWQALGGVFPWAAAVALSPIPIIAVTLILGTPRARSNGVAFASGWVAGLTAVSAIVFVVAAASGADDPDSDSATVVDVIRLAVGGAFFSMAFKQLQRRPRAGHEPEMPGWMSAIDGFSAGKSLGLGATLSGVNPKNLALTFGAAASVAQSGISGAGSSLALAAYVLIGSLTVVGPVTYFLVASERASKTLASVKQFMSAHSPAIMFVLLVVLGAKFVGDGVAGLAG